MGFFPRTRYNYFKKFIVGTPILTERKRPNDQKKLTFIEKRMMYRNWFQEIGTSKYYRKNISLSPPKKEYITNFTCKIQPIARTKKSL